MCLHTTSASAATNIYETSDVKHGQEANAGTLHRAVTEEESNLIDIHQNGCDLIRTKNAAGSRFPSTADLTVAILDRLAADP